MKPEGMSEAAWLELHKVIAEIELRIESEITSKIKPQAMAEERLYRLDRGAEGSQRMKQLAVLPQIQVRPRN